jgi:ribosomal protein S18 acetylase RimI-like enzyme
MNIQANLKQSLLIFTLLVFHPSLSAGRLDELKEKNLEIVDFDKNEHLKGVVKIYKQHESVLGGSEEIFSNELPNNSFIKILLRNEIKKKSVIGFAKYGWHSGLERDEGAIDLFALDNNNAGKGYGRLFLSHVIGHIAQCNRTNIKLDVYRDNFGAITFYEKMGFKLMSDDDVCVMRKKDGDKNDLSN